MPPVKRTVASLIAIMIALCATVFIATSEEVDHVRGDFCDYIGAHYEASLLLPQNQARLIGERNDRQLLRKLDC
jgi:hypothetical protein